MALSEPAGYTRILDYLYLTFFAIHIPVMLCADLVSLYPPSIVPAPIAKLQTWYVTTYEDRFFISPPAWFSMFLWMEALFHLPFSFYAFRAIYNRDQTATPYLLVWAVQTAMSTMTCIADYHSWTAVRTGVVDELNKLYVPYCILAWIMGVDMLFRLHRQLSPSPASKAKTVKQR